IGHCVYRGDTAARYANWRDRCNRVRAAPVADVDAHATFVRLFLLLAHAAISCGNATSARCKRLCHFMVGFAGARLASSRLTVPARRAALRQHIYCHAAVIYRTVNRALAQPATKTLGIKFQFVRGLVMPLLGKTQLLFVRPFYLKSMGFAVVLLD